MPDSQVANIAEWHKFITWFKSQYGNKAALVSGLNLGNYKQSPSYSFWKSGIAPQAGDNTDGTVVQYLEDLNTILQSEVDKGAIDESTLKQTYNEWYTRLYINREPLMTDAPYFKEIVADPKTLEPVSTVARQSYISGILKVLQLIRSPRH